MRRLASALKTVSSPCTFACSKIWPKSLSLFDRRPTNFCPCSSFIKLKKKSLFSGNNPIIYKTYHLIIKFSENFSVKKAIPVRHFNKNVPLNLWTRHSLKSQCAECFPPPHRIQTKKPKKKSTHIHSSLTYLETADGKCTLKCDFFMCPTTLHKSQ